MYLYLLINDKSNKLYIGITKNLKQRLIEHNATNRHYTGRSTGEWSILKYVKFNDETEARKEELRLKKSKNKKYVLWYFTNKRP